MEVNGSAHKNTNPYSLNHYIPLIVVAVFVGLFFTTFTGLYQRWIKWDEGVSHGLLVIVLFVVLLAKALPWVAHPQSKLLHFALCLTLGLSSLAWYLFHTLNVFILEQLILLPLLALVVAACFSIKTAIRHRLLLLLPIFSIPVWDQLNDPLLNMSAAIVGKMVRAINMPALIDGNSIYIPYGQILIADGCSGLRYFVIALAIGYVIAYLNRYNEKRLLATLAVAGLLGLIANWIRIFILILVGYQSEMQSPLMADHEYFGWILFSIICLPAIYFAPVVRHQPDPPTAANTTKARLLFPLAALSIGPVCALLFNPQPEPTPWQDLLPVSMQPIATRNMPLQILAPASGYRENAQVVAQNQPIFIQVDQYQRHNKSEKLVPYITRLYNYEEWSEIDSYPIADNPGRITLFRQKNGLKKIAQLQWMDVGGYLTHTLTQAKLLQIPAQFHGQNRFVIMTLQGECNTESCDNAVAALRRTASLIHNTKGH